MATVRLHHPTKSANPAYSFGKKREERLNIVPGPATYDPLPVKPKHNGHKMSSQPRLLHTISSTPGPGHYRSFSTSTFDTTQGTGSFSKAIARTLSASRISSKSRTLDMSNGQQRMFGASPSTDQLPGPGSYYATETNRSKSPQYTLGEVRFEKTEDVAAPGSYNNASFDDRETREGLIPKQERMNQTIDNTPGTRRYNNESRNNTKRNPSYSMNEAQIQKLLSKEPGPGAYDPVRAREKKLGHSFSQAKRVKEIQRQPGPGDYELGSIVKPSTKGLPSRTGRTQYISNNPGVGQYNVDKPKHNISYTIPASKKPKDKSHVDAQDPTKYNPNYEQKTRQPAYTFRKQKEPRKTITPGPATYKPDIQNTKRARTPAYSMPQSSRPNIKTATRAGPGTYETTRPHISKNQTVSRSQRQLLQVQSDNPGPGYYHRDEEPRQKLLSNKFSSAPIRQLSKSHSPGVCRYNVKPIQTAAPMYTIPEKRVRKTDISPGPGTYNINNLVNYCKSRSACYTMPKSNSSSPVKVPTTEHNPGPGAYHQEYSPGEGSPKAIIVPNRLKDIETSPGPGDYSPKDMKSSSSIGSRLSRMERQLHSINSNPSPGQYNVPIGTNKSPSHAFSKAERPTEFFLNDHNTSGINIPAAVPNAPKYLLPDNLLQKYSIDN